jgi:hypothetical protein
MVSDRILRANTVGLIGGYNAEAYFCFGSDFLNRVVALKDCRSDNVRKPDSKIDCIVVENFDEHSIDPTVLLGYRRIFEASHNGTTRLVYFERVTPN